MLTAIYLILLSTVLGKLGSIADVMDGPMGSDAVVYAFYGAALFALLASMYFAIVSV